MIDLRLHAQEFNDALTRFIRFSRMEESQAVRYQSMLLARRLVQFTPPKTRVQGRRAVARDIERAVTPLTPRLFQSPQIKALIRRRDYSALETVFSRFHGGRFAGYSVKPFTPQLHLSRRDRRGRVTKPARVASPDASEIRAYIKSIQRRVGRGKSGWAAAAQQLGGSVPGWVAEHAVTGRVEDRSGNLDPRVKMINASEWAGGNDVGRVVSDAIRARKRHMLVAIEKGLANAVRRSGLKR